MNSVAPLIHAFYNPQLSVTDRQTVHTRLLESLSTDACVAASDSYVAQCAAALRSITASTALETPDSLVLHYALHAIETRLRTGFGVTAPATRKALQEHLVDFVIAAFVWNTRVAGQQQLAKSLPMHVVTKAARVAVELGKREWVADATCAFPRVVLALIDQNGHSADSLPRIFAGMLILTTLVDDALDTSRADVRASDRVVLNKRLSSIADGVVAALEIGLRICGPGLPSNIPAAAARTIGSITRVAPSVASSAIDVLRRRSSGLGSCNTVGAETLGVLADLYGESKVALPGPWQSVLRHLADILNAVAMGETAHDESQPVALFCKRLTMYAEAVICRCIASEGGSADMEHVLNGFMGVTMRWAKHAPSALPDALDAWINVLEVLEDGDAPVTPLLATAYGALARLCAEGCMHSTNASVLRLLDSSYPDESDDDDDESTQVSDCIREDAEVLAEMGSRPAVYAIMPSSFGLGGSGSGEDDVEECELGYVTRDVYINKCVEALIAVSRVFRDTVAPTVAELCVQNLSTAIPAAAVAASEVLRDLDSACVLACAVAVVFPAGSTPTCILTSAVVGVFVQSPINRKSPTPGEYLTWRGGLDVKVLQVAAALAPTMTSTNWAEGPGVRDAFVQSARGIVSKSGVPRPLAVAASLLLLTLGELSREAAFACEPPMSATLLLKVTSLPACCLGFVGIVRWVVGGVKLAAVGSKGRVTADAWPPRMASLQQESGLLLSSYFSACSTDHASVNAVMVREIARGACLVWSIFSCLFEESGDCKDAVWSSIGRETCVKTLQGLQTLCRIASPDENGGAPRLGEDETRFVQSVVGVVVGTMGCALRVFRRQVASEAPRLAQDVISSGLAAAKYDSSPRLARALLALLREQLGDGFSKDKEFLVEPAVNLAAQSLGGDVDVTVAAVGVLAEALNRHWLMFWPGDVASHLGDSSPLQSPTATSPSEAVRKVYGIAFGGIMSAIQHSDAAVSREGMLALERIDASRKFYSRDSAFRSIGGGAATVGACIGAMWSSPLVSDEACGVVWGVAKADWNSFYGGNGSLSGAVLALRACSETQAAGLVEEFGQPTDRPTFNRALVALVNDLRFTRTMNAGPSM